MDAMTEPEIIWRLAKSHMAHTSFMQAELMQAVIDYMGGAALSVPDWESAQGLMQRYWLNGEGA